LVPLAALTLSLAASAQLAEPVKWGSPDQPYGRRRSVTDADRAAIKAYRSGNKKPVLSTMFSTPSELQEAWDIVQDDNRSGDFLSCRRAGNVEPTSAGLRLKTMVATDCTNRWSTGYIASKEKYSYGFFEARIKIADVAGMNNAFWLTTDDNYEVDIAEMRYPNYIHIGLQYWPPKGSQEKHTGVGWGAKFVENFSEGFHDIGMLWTPTDMVFEVDGEPVAAAALHGSVKGPVQVRLSTALLGSAGKVPEHPEGHDMVVKSIRIYGQ
jgi:hypothetical protein